MVEHLCSHPTCYESEETATMYKEESNHGSAFPVCGDHVSEQKCRDGKVAVIMSSTNRAAEEANAAVLAGLQE